MKCAILCAVITLHHVDMSPKRNSNHGVIYFMKLFAYSVWVHVRKRISNEFSFHTMYYETTCVFYITSPEARGHKTHNEFHNTSYGMKIHLRSYIYILYRKLLAKEQW